MKFQVTFKDPDVVHDAIQEAVKQEVDKLGLSKEETDAVIELRHEKVARFTSRWVEYGEYITVEFDTEAGTAVVVPDK